MKFREVQEHCGNDCPCSYTRSPITIKRVLDSLGGLEAMKRKYKTASEVLKHFWLAVDQLENDDLSMTHNDESLEPNHVKVVAWIESNFPGSAKASVVDTEPTPEDKGTKTDVW